MARRAVGCYEVIWDGPKTDQIDKSNYSETQLAVLVNGHLSEWFQTLVIDKEIHCHHGHLIALFLERTMDKIKNRQNSGESVHGNRVNNLRFADDI